MGETHSKSLPDSYAEERAARIKHILSLSNSEEDASNLESRKKHLRAKSIQDEQYELEKEEEQRKSLEKSGRKSFHLENSPRRRAISEIVRRSNSDLHAYEKREEKEIEGIVAYKKHLPGYSDDKELADSVPKGYSPVKNLANITSGYSFKSSEIKSYTPESKSLENLERKHQIDDENADMMYEVVGFLERMNAEEKLDFGLKMVNKNPGLIRSLRNELRSQVSLLEKKRSKSESLKTEEYWDWNNTFQSLMEELNLCEEQSQERMEIYADIAKLAQDFIHCATTYGKLIISEVGVPYSEKTIKPMSIGGIAGGEKYVVKNILFKFALDKNELYGSDEAAAKAAGHDLLGLIHYFNIGIPDLHFPLMALVDFMGYRLQAMTLLPINKSTIIYGTPDGGKTIYDENPKFNAKMKLAAQKLRLKPHYVGLSPNDKGVLMYSCADLEGHEGEDGRYYCLDFARCFPPIVPDSNLKNSHLYRLFRPEFVKKYEIPLCPDTFSGFVANHDAKEQIQEIKEATLALYTKNIPNFAQELNGMESESQLTQNSIKESMHKRGINLCFLGMIRQNLTNQKFKNLFLVEMIARVARHQINERLRAKMQELKIDLQQPYKVVVIHYMNSLFGSSEESTNIWKEIKSDINRNYPSGLTEEENGVDYDLKRFLAQNSLLCVLFKKLTKYSGLKFTQYAEEEFSTNPESFDSTEPFDDTDLEELGERIKHMNIVAAAMGYYLSQKALVKSGEISYRLFQQAIEKFEEALSSNPGDKTTLRELANVQAILGEKELAKQYFKEAISADELDPITWLKYAEFLEESNELEPAEQAYLKSLECDPDYHVALVKYGDFLERIGNRDEAEKFYELAKRHTDVSSIKEEELWENERRKLFGFKYSKNNLLPTDRRGPWSTKKGVPRRSMDIKLPANWEWIDEWSIDKERPGVDAEGWEYAFSWKSTWYPQPSSTTHTFVRRRRWKRTRRFKNEATNSVAISLEDVINKMRNPNGGLSIKDRKWRNKTFEKCFIGKEAVEWMVSNLKVSKRQALQLGKKLIDQNYIYHVTYDHNFVDGYLFYGFTGSRPKNKIEGFTIIQRKPMAEDDFNKVIKEGYMQKQGAWVKNWKRRYFILKKGSLFYYKEREDKIPRGIINLLNASVVPVHEKESDIQGPHYVFGIKTGFRTWWIACKDNTTKLQWMQTIQQACINNSMVQKT